MSAEASGSEYFDKREAQILSNIRAIEGNLEVKVQELQHKFTSDATQTELTVRAKVEQMGKKAENIAEKVKTLSLNYQMKHNPAAVLWAAAGLGMILGRLLARKKTQSV